MKGHRYTIQTVDVKGEIKSRLGFEYEAKCTQSYCRVLEETTQEITTEQWRSERHRSHEKNKVRLKEFSSISS